MHGNDNLFLCLAVIQMKVLWGFTTKMSLEKKTQKVLSDFFNVRNTETFSKNTCISTENVKKAC